MKYKMTFSSVIITFTALSLLFISALVAVIDSKVTNKLDGVLWTVPAKVFSRSLEIAEGKKINQSNFRKELDLLSYRKRDEVKRPGEYLVKGSVFKIFLRGYENQKAGIFNVVIKNNLVTSIKSQDKQEIDLIKLEPLMIGGIFPSHMEDRILLDYSQVPQTLLETILSVEDQDFYNHWGVSLKSIFRALFVNLSSGEIEQGGSTITQQLAKSLFFSSEQTIKRKVMEAIAAILIELHYSKKEILLAYVNDVFLSQSGRRAIHGFGMGAQHFFGTNIQNLDVDQIALLVGMLKGPSLYNPRRNPVNALKRRNLVLNILFLNKKIDRQEFENLSNKELGIVPPSFKSETKYPAFHDLVRIELRKNYEEKSMRTQGLRVETNINPLFQTELERSAQETKSSLVQKYGKSMEDIELAAVAINISSGEIEAIVGSSNPGSFGFNRSINAIRPIGSLVKPFVYLSALKNYQKYTLSSLLDDSKLILEMGNNKTWEPKNFDKKYHGEVPLHEALSQSYNIASARLGLELGYDQVGDTFQRLGIEQKLSSFPSVFVGAFEMSPLQVTQAYHTIASDGFYTPLRSIRNIKDSQGNLEMLYPYKIEQRFRPEIIGLIRFAMERTFVSGTARKGFKLEQIKPLGLAGKSGTSDEQRDSWFVGLAGDHLVTIWLGFDDNRKTLLTGRTGAFELWKNFIQRIDPLPIDRPTFSRLNYVWTDRDDGKLSSSLCKNSLLIPYIRGTEPREMPTKRALCLSRKN